MDVKIRSGVSALLVSSLLLLAACGGGGGDGGGVALPAVQAPATGVWAVPDLTAAAPELVAAFGADNLYYNAHTSANQAGEIRGQLDGPGAVKFAALTGAQETPPVATSALGGGVLAVDGATGRMSGFVVAAGLNGIAAHVHNAARGTPGPVVVPLSGGPELWFVPDGTIVPAEVIAAFAADNLYFNVHTAANPDGEIRGQIDAGGPAKFATLTGAQETPPVATTALGGGALAVDGATGRAGGFMVTGGLNGIAAHVHNATRGVPGAVVIPLLEGSLGGGRELWVVPDGTIVPAAVIAAFAADNLYYNSHTPANPDGEIRGQLDAGGPAKFAALNGTQETPPVTTSAFGAGALAVDGVAGRAGGFVLTAGLNGIAAHVHNAARGVPGPIVIPLLSAP